MRVITNDRRDNRKFYARQVAAGILALVAVGPNVLSSYCGRTGYFFCGQKTDGDLVLLSNNPAKTTAEVHARAGQLYGVPAKIKNNNTSGLKIAKIKKEKVAKVA